MKPFLHAKSSAAKFGGVPEDYQDIHDFMDSSKAHLADPRHRAILHSTFGCFIVEKVFGTTRTNSEGKVYSTRDVAEQHCTEDLGKIPTVQDWLKELPIESWMSQPVSSVTTYEAEVAEPMGPSQMLSKIAEAKGMMQSAISAVQKQGIESLGAYFRPIFDDPNIVGICWAQYTPYFMDGDPCVFSTNDMEVLTLLQEYNGLELCESEYAYHGRIYDILDLMDPDDHDDADCPVPSELRAINEGVYTAGRWVELGYPMPPLLEELRKLHWDDDLCEALFGDHAFVVLTKDGFTVEEYEHD